MDRWAILNLLESLGGLAGDGDAEGYVNALYDARNRYERQLPQERRGDGWSGAYDGEVIRAPWRGEFDMPGNFERGQRMGNSLANDVMLDNELSYKFQYDPRKGIDAYYQPFVPLGGVAGKFHNDAFTQPIHYTGPIDTGKQILHPNSPRNWDPTWDWVGPDGPPTRGGFFAGRDRGPETPRQKRFRDWIWRDLMRG